jgi:aryl-alcohol dehydrogenase-like predicted oxidoreductase
VSALAPEVGSRGQRHIGGVAVGAIGLGTMPLSIEGRPSERDSLRVVHAALDAGLTLLDTADAYSLGGSDCGHGELLIAKALRTWSGDPDSVLVSTKGGHIKSSEGIWSVDSRPTHLRAAAEASLARLGTETIGLYHHHRPDPNVAYEDVIGTLRDLQDEGKLRLVGISNADTDQIDLAVTILGAGRLAAVQNQYSLAFRSSEAELRHAQDRDIAFLPWSPFGGADRAGLLNDDQPAVSSIAHDHAVSPQQVVLAWMLAKGPTVIPIPGASRVSTVLDCADAINLCLTDDEMQLLDGTRHLPDET